MQSPGPAGAPGDELPAPHRAGPGTVAADPRVAFVLELGRALHRYGTPSHRLEDALDRVSRRLGLEGQFFSLPTSIFAAFGDPERQNTHLLRVEPGEVQLEKLARLDAIAREVSAGTLAPGEGAARVHATIAAAPPYGAVLTLAAFSAASAAAARFLGGGVREIAVAAAIGLSIALLAQAIRPRSAASRLFEPVAALVASAIATLATLVLGPYAGSIATLAGLIVLLPGLTITTAMTELSSRHLASGTMRLAAAAVVFLGIAFGVALGGRMIGGVAGPLVAAPVLLPAWTEWAALAIAPVSFAVLLRAAPRDVPAIVACCVAAFAGGRIGAAALGPELGVFAGALTAGWTANLYAWRTGRPSTVLLAPAILMLVPGSVGFRSLALLIDRQVVSGLETAFRMVLMFAALVAGLLMANLVEREPRGDSAPG